MTDLSHYFAFNTDQVHWHHFYIYLALGSIIAYYLVVKSDSKYKVEMFFLSFYLLTGNINDLLTLKVPGLSFFEIQPERFLFIISLFFILRKALFSRQELALNFDRKVPWFQVALYGYVIMLIISEIVNITEIGMKDAIKTILDSIAFLVIIIAFKLMADRPSYNIIGKSIIIGAVISSLVSLVQFSIDPYFLRIGDNREAFGAFLRSNGIFSTEYFNSYYLIVAIAWTFASVKKDVWKTILITLFSIGVLSSFQRMSWLVLALTLATYLILIRKVALEKMVVCVLSGLAVLLCVSIFYYQDIMNSTLVKQRLSEPVDSRKGYYTMVLDNIGKKPLFGYGGLKNEVYYENLLRITKDRDRAAAVTGDLHSGYFSALFLYGVPAFVFFTLFVVLSVLYYARFLNYDLYFVVPFLVSILYMIGNLTNTFLFLKYISILFAIHIGIGMGIKRIKQPSAGYV